MRIQCILFPLINPDIIYFHQHRIIECCIIDCTTHRSSYGHIENQEEVINLANQFNAIPVFAGLRLSCISTDEKNIPFYGGEYIAEITGLKVF